MKQYIETWKQTFNYSGRSRRKEYWMFQLYTFVLMALFVFAFVPLADAVGLDGIVDLCLALLFPIFGVALTLCNIALTIRRLHDINNSGWMILLGLIPFVGGIILLVMAVIDTKPEGNQWGLSPKYPLASEAIEV